MLNIKYGIFFKYLYSHAINKINEVNDELNKEDKVKEVVNYKLSAGSIITVLKMLYSSHIYLMMNILVRLIL